MNLAKIQKNEIPDMTHNSWKIEKKNTRLQTELFNTSVRSLKFLEN